MPVFNQLAQKYGEAHRAYHNLNHVESCLRELGSIKAAANALTDVEIALWFHDIEYDPRSTTNEAASANYAILALDSLDINERAAEYIASLILATTHRGSATDPEEQTIADIDLAILGAPEEEYFRYALSIRAEHAFRTREEFRTGRSAVLTKFLERPHIYYLPYFREQYEERARENLIRELQLLAA